MFTTKSQIISLLYISITIIYVFACGNPDDSVIISGDNDDDKGVVPVTRIEVVPKSSSIAIGDTIHLSCKIYPENATNQEVKWSSNDSSMAIVSNKGVVTAVSEGYCEVYASIEGFMLKGSTKLHVIDSDIYKAVDLGLPSGTKWGSEDAVLFYAWGDTDFKYSFSWSSYKWEKSENSNYYLTKYCNEDSLKKLNYGDDVAYVFGGRKWRTPTRNEFQELIDECTWIFEDLSYIDFEGRMVTKGRYKVIGTNGNFIFFNFNGEKTGNQTNRIGEKGLYWTCEIADEYSVNRNTPGDNPYKYASVLSVSDKGVRIAPEARFHGLPTRPIRIEE